MIWATECVRVLPHSPLHHRPHLLPGRQETRELQVDLAGSMAAAVFPVAVSEEEAAALGS